MSSLFKGPWLHWGALLIGFSILSFAGMRGLHVREFPLFLFVVLSISLGLVLLVALSRRDND